MQKIATAENVTYKRAFTKSNIRYQKKQQKKNRTTIPYCDLEFIIENSYDFIQLGFWGEIKYFTG